MEPTQKWLRVPGLAARYAYSPNTIYRLVQKGLLPKLVRIGPNMSAAPAAEVDAVDQARLAGADDAAVKKLVTNLAAQRQVNA